MRFTNRELGLGALGCLITWSFPACGGDEERAPPGAFGSAARGGAAGAAGKGGGSGKAGRGGRGSGGASGAGAETGDAGDNASGGSSGDGSGTGGGSGGEGDGGTSGKASRGGTGNDGSGGTGNDGSGAYAGELLPGPDLDCPNVSGSVGAALCDPDADWDSGERVLSEAVGPDVLLSITPDELTVAWRYADALQPAYYTADRSSADTEFGAGTALEPAAIDGAEGFALSPDGLRLVIAAHGQFTELQRQARNSPFVNAGTGSFMLLAADAAAKSLRLADPVIAPDDLMFFYSVENASDAYTLFVSKREPGALWPVGVAVEECDLKRHSTGMRRPTALSADGLTLFYQDEPRGQPMAAFRAGVAEPFSEFVKLEGYAAPRPNAACDRLYFSGLDDGQLQLLVAGER
jgi:hypothetical protein